MITSCEEIKVKSKINEAQSDVQNKIRNLSLDEDKPAEKARSMPMVTSPHCSALHIYTLYEARGKSCYLLPATFAACCFTDCRVTLLIHIKITYSATYLFSFGFG